MSMQDPISDMLTRIRNGQSAEKQSITMPSSKLKVSIAELLKHEGYIVGWNKTDGKVPQLTIELKYHNGEPVIAKIKRISRPGLRVYKKHDELPREQAGLGVVVVSTSKGLLTDREAKAQRVGGEILFSVA